MKILITISFLIFLLGILIGYCSYHKCKSISYNLNYTNSFYIIVNNNLKSDALLLLGALSFGFTTFSTLLINAIYVGMELHKVKVQDILLILPHGIFEIPAIIIAGAAGFKIPYEIIRYLMGKKEQPLTKEDIKEYLTLALISIVLIVIAAWIEANITLKIARVMLRKGI